MPGEMTLADFRADLTTALSRGTVSTTLLDRWINASYREFGYAFKFPELEKKARVALVAGTNVVAIPSDWRAWHEDGVWLYTPTEQRGRILPETRTNYLRNISEDADAWGVPARYHRFGKSIYFRPFPDAANSYGIEYHYWATLAKLVAVNDVSIFAEDWDDCIFTGALYRGYRSFGEFDRYQNVRADFLGMVRSRVMQEDLSEFPEGGISVVNPDEQDFESFDGNG